MSIDILFDPSSLALGRISHSCVEGSISLVRPFAIDVNCNLIIAIAKCGEYATDSSCANRVRLSVLERRVHSAFGSEYANSRDAIGRRHRVAKDPGPTLPDDRGRSDVSFGESL